MGTLKIIHMSCALLALAGFTLRGVWMLADSPLLQRRWVKIAPHIIDTLLLGSALVLAVQMHLSPTQQPWLLAKILALVLYIGLGTVALKRGKTKTVRGVAWVAALMVFGYIMVVATIKSPWGYLALL
ncbi:regulator SirB [Exilibacterium tricleocarpae]|uniref:Regulator SirB n=1 Tax=Exilibacterium tricleocarpae TaxID=2591008 RepID=A0A545U8D3_9GAMM|nr:SirB2 family protein [Exilibacterium tricleocarpae]TQV85718.1 regulator SirB [Exilibacterium tricleocarpae]